MLDPSDDFEELPGEEAAEAGGSWVGEAYLAFYDEQGNPVGIAPVASAGFEEGFYDEHGDPVIWDDPEEPDDDPDAGGGAGVREPRRPLPGAPSTAAEADPDEST